MNGDIPSSSRSVPSIHILNADDASTLFEGEVFPPEICNNFYNASEDIVMYPYSQDLQSEYLPPNPSELEEMSEFAHLTTTGQAYLTGPGYSIPYSAIIQENGTMAGAEGGLSPSSVGSTFPSPSSGGSGGSLSPFYDSSAFSDTESPLSPSPTTPDRFVWSMEDLNHPFMGSFSSESVNITVSLDSQNGPHRPRSHSSPSPRRGPVASKAMLEANGRRRRHPALFECKECKQTFTALFSLKRHVQSHTGERPFACGITGCPQRFFNSSDCKRHEKSRKRHKDLLTQ